MFKITEKQAQALTVLRHNEPLLKMLESWKEDAINLMTSSDNAFVAGRGQGEYLVLNKLIESIENSHELAVKLKK